MSSKLAYKRILLKISGESLKGSRESGYDSDAVTSVAKRLKTAQGLGAEIALVVGAGNIWRGLAGSKGGMDRVTADYMGMLATVMNALCLQDALRGIGAPCSVQTAVPMHPFAKRFDRDSAMKGLAAGEILIFAGGTGSPFFTTDTTAALRALETGCKAVLKATKVNGIYTADPMKCKDATRYEKLSFAEALSKRLEVMDLSAFSLCSDNKLPIIVFNFSEDGALGKVLKGDFSVGTLVS